MRLAYLIVLAIALVPVDLMASTKASMQDVDLGTIPQNTPRVAQVVIRNIDDSDIELRSLELSGNDGSFTLPTLTFPMLIPEGGSYVVNVTVVLTDTLVHRVRVVAQIDDDGTPEDTTSCMITVKGLAGAVPVPVLRFAMADTVARVGERLFVPILCVEGQDWLEDQGVRAITTRLRYRGTVLTFDGTPSGTSTDMLDRLIEYPVVGALLGPIAQLLPFTACLGDTSVAEITMEQIRFEVDTGTVIIDTTITADVTIIDAWQNGRPRSVTRDPLAPALEIFPNPAWGPVTFSLHACTDGATLVIHDLQGREVTAPYEHVGSENPRDVHVSLDLNLPPGSYFCTYRSNDTVVQRPFVIQR